jgi:hypothetical protein
MGNHTTASRTVVSVAWILAIMLLAIGISQAAPPEGPTLEGQTSESAAPAEPTTSTTATAAPAGLPGGAPCPQNEAGYSEPQKCASHECWHDGDDYVCKPVQ